MTQLEVQLTADIKRLKSQLRSAQAELKRTGKVADQANARVGRSFTRAGKGAVNATPALQEFSRVIQDAPFGIQGVANNVQQLTANFGNLSRSAGGTLPALRAMLGALSGPTGILLAVSTVTSLLVVFGDELFRSKKSAESLTDSLERLNDQFDAELKLNREIEKNLELQGKSTTGILNTRKDILREQLKGLSVLIRQQQELLNIQIAENQTISNWEALVGYFNQAFNALTGIGKVTAFIALQSDAARKFFTPLLNAYSKGRDILIENSNAQAASTEGLQKQQELQNKLNNLLAQQKSLENEILRINQEQIRSREFKIGLPQSPFANFIQPDLLAGQAKLAFKNLRKVLAEDGPTIIVPQLSNIEQRFANFKNRLANSTLDLASAVGGGFAQLGQALAQGGNLLGAVGASILSIMGDIATQLGQAAIAAGIAGLALKNLFSNPFAAIAAGGALVAIGAALKSAQSSVSGIGSGGGGNVGGQGNIGTPSFSGSTVSGGGAFNGRVVFEISGRKLIGVLNNTLSAGERLGGNVGLR